VVGFYHKSESKVFNWNLAKKRILKSIFSFVFGWAICFLELFQSSRKWIESLVFNAIAWNWLFYQAMAIPLVYLHV